MGGSGAPSTAQNILRISGKLSEESRARNRDLGKAAAGVASKLEGAHLSDCGPVCNKRRIAFA